MSRYIKAQTIFYKMQLYSSFSCHLPRCWWSFGSKTCVMDARLWSWFSTPTDLSVHLKFPRFKISNAKVIKRHVKRISKRTINKLLERIYFTPVQQVSSISCCLVFVICWLLSQLDICFLEENSDRLLGCNHMEQEIR